MKGAQNQTEPTTRYVCVVGNTCVRRSSPMERDDEHEDDGDDGEEDEEDDGLTTEVSGEP